ncbi:transposase [Rhodococcus sp. T2V]|uniref:transposase n=1 Tax=Rhodococcus sp. T2V TaxID=3034164 RepID=UPI0034E23559
MGRRKRVNGRKRHVVTDLLGLLVVVLVTAASVQDRDGGRLALSRAKTVMPWMVLVWADGGYAGRLVAWVAEHCRMTLDIVRKPKGRIGFSVLPHRWLIERTLAWIVRCRRLDHDYERLPAHSEAIIKSAMIGLMTRRLAPPADDVLGSRPARRDTFKTLSELAPDPSGVGHLEHGPAQGHRMPVGGDQPRWREAGAEELDELGGPRRPTGVAAVSTRPHGAITVMRKVPRRARRPMRSSPRFSRSPPRWRCGRRGARWR